MGWPLQGRRTHLLHSSGQLVGVGSDAGFRKFSRLQAEAYPPVLIQKEPVLAVRTQRSPKVSADLLPPCSLTMWTFMLLGLLCASASASAIQARSSSYSGEYGSGRGEPFSHSDLQLEGPITAIRVRADSFNIVGLQVRYGQVWSDYVGGKLGDLEEIFLHPGESVIAVSGSYGNYLKTLNFYTDEGRFLSFGKGTGVIFYAVPLDLDAVLRFISGRAGLFINAIGLHWDTIPETASATAEPASSVAGPRGGV
uniref:Jacalin-type lectin domain-containing protein n=1 Tax=Oryctolagus cuniculus TaxID=9986 RepID=A0A5F9DT24_RABIT